jgi:hypothetical protein
MMAMNVFIYAAFLTMTAPLYSTSGNGTLDCIACPVLIWPLQPPVGRIRGGLCATPWVGVPCSYT